MPEAAVAPKVAETISHTATKGDGTHAVAQIDNRECAVAQRHSQEAVTHSPHQVAQRQAALAINSSPRQVAQQQAAAQLQARPNQTGLPDKLKAGVENLSGYSLDDVQVHYNSAQPAQLQAHAYAQGSDIHVAPGQEQHLPHEAWHVVQQKQGRVRPTMQLKGKVAVNDDSGLEREADNMGAKALNHQTTQTKEAEPASATSISANSGVIQRAIVSGVRNNGKSQTEIGNDMHAILQEEFLNSDLASSYNLYTEYQIGGGRADLVAINDERDDDGLGDCWIYVGEIKSDALVWYGAGAAYQQLDAYIQSFRNDPMFYGAYVGRLNFWNPTSEGRELDGDGYDCTLFMRNRGAGLYTYVGRVMPAAINSLGNELDDEEMVEVPFNEATSS